LEEAALDGWDLCNILSNCAAFKTRTGCTNNIYFMGTWNNFLTPLIIMSDSEMFTLPGLNTFKGQYISYWNYIMAASMIFTLPAGNLCLFNRYFIQGVTFTGSK